VYSTYLGGSPEDFGPRWTGGSGIAVDSSGNAYVTGSTESEDFPITRGALNSGTGTSCWNYSYYWAEGDVAFVTKLNPPARRWFTQPPSEESVTTGVPG
jgi:hypothetical protein